MKLRQTHTPSQPAQASSLLTEAYRLLCEAEFHLRQHGFTLGTGNDGAFLARSAEFRERLSGSVDLRLRRAIERAYGKGAR